MVRGGRAVLLAAAAIAWMLIVIGVWVGAIAIVIHFVLKFW